MSTSALEIATAVTDAQPEHVFVELVWPGKTKTASVTQEADGNWKITHDAITGEAFRPLVDLEHHSSDGSASGSLLIGGQRIDAMRTLSRALGRFIRLAYLDLPRINVDDAEATFKGDPSFVFSRWLAVVSAHLKALEPMLRRDAVVVLHAGETEQAYAALLANQHFRAQSVGTVVWQRAYAPRNMKGMKEFTSTNDFLTIVAKDKTALPPVGLRRLPEGYDNADQDPRGAWKAEHKGAKTRRENSNFNTYVPPYRWSVTDGSLPKGLWRLSPLTGVIWGYPEELGKFPFTIEVTDSEGATSSRRLVLEVVPEGIPPQGDAMPWIFEQFETSGRLKVKTTDLPVGVLGKEYMAVCFGAGGTPFHAPPKRPGSGRYWEFAKDTLIKAYQRDAVYLGKGQPTAIPHPKQFAPPDGELVVENQQTWWPARTGKGQDSQPFGGYTEDATKHLKVLKELKLIETEVSSAKPEHLLARLIDIFTDPHDYSLEVFGNSADLAAVSLKKGRRFVTLTGASERDRTLSAGCSEQRLKAVTLGHDSGLDEKADEIRMRHDAYLPYEGGGSFTTAQMGEWIVRRETTEDLASLNFEHYRETSALISAILTLEGFIPLPERMGYGHSIVGNTLATVISPSVFLTPELASDFVSIVLERKSDGVIYYFRASSDFDPSALPQTLKCKRIPFDLGI